MYSVAREKAVLIFVVGKFRIAVCPQLIVDMYDYFVNLLKLLKGMNKMCKIKKIKKSLNVALLSSKHQNI